MAASATTSNVHDRAQRALNNSSIHALRDLTVEHRGETLVLSGRVESFYLKQLAQEVVRSETEDIQVVNSIDVNYGQQFDN